MTDHVLGFDALCSDLQRTLLRLPLLSDRYPAEFARQSTMVDHRRHAAVIERERLDYLTLDVWSRVPTDCGGVCCPMTPPHPSVVITDHSRALPLRLSYGSAHANDTEVAIGAIGGFSPRRPWSGVAWRGWFDRFRMCRNRFFAPSTRSGSSVGID